MDTLLRALLTGRWPFGLPKEAELAAAIDALPMAVWLYASDGRPVAISNRWTKLTGQTIEDWRAHGWAAVVHPEDHERVTAGWEGFPGTEIRAGRHEYRIVHAETGAVRHVADRVVRIDCADSAVYVGFTEDVTARAEARHEALRLGAKQDALRRVAEFVAARPDIAAVADAVSREVALLFDVEAGAVVRFEDDGDGLVAGLWSATPMPGLEVGTKIDLAGPHAASAVYRTGVAVRVRPPPGPGVLLPALVERVAVPVRVGGRLWGALSINSAVPGGIPAAAEERLARFADLVALAISETEAREALQRRFLQQTAVNELSALALAVGGLDDLLDTAIGRVAEILGTSSAYVVEAIDNGDAVARAAAGSAEGHVGVRFAASPDTMTGAALADGASIVVEDFASDERFGADVGVDDARPACAAVRASSSGCPTGCGAWSAC